MGDAIQPKQDITAFVWTLVDGEQRAKEHPETFEIPSRAERERLDVGNFAKLIFVTPEMVKQNIGERMWVRVLSRKKTNGAISYSGQLDNSPGLIAGLHAGSDITFGPQHVVEIESTKAGGGGGALILLAFAFLSGKRRGRR